MHNRFAELSQNSDQYFPSHMQSTSVYSHSTPQTSFNHIKSTAVNFSPTAANSNNNNKTGNTPSFNPQDKLHCDYQDNARESSLASKDKRRDHNTTEARARTGHKNTHNVNN
jgi:hypothetical protein